VYLQWSLSRVVGRGAVGSDFSSSHTHLTFLERYTQKLMSHEKDLSPTERAAYEQHIESLKNGIFESQAELQAAVRHPVQRLTGPLGDLARGALDVKAHRTQEAGYSLGGDKHRVIDRNGGFKSATAYRNTDGTYHAIPTVIDSPTGLPPEQQQEQQ